MVDGGGCHFSSRRWVAFCDVKHDPCSKNRMYSKLNINFSENLNLSQVVPTLLMWSPAHCHFPSPICFGTVDAPVLINLGLTFMMIK